MIKQITLSCLLLPILTIGQNNCEKFVKDYIPIDLEEAIEYFECKTPEDALKQFAEKNEDEAVAQIHLSTGMSIRNNWKLWARTSKIANYFMDLGIFHPDDMSGIILTSFHRKVNGKEIQLSEQVKFYKDYWAESERKEKERRKMEFSEYKVGDLVEFTYDHDFVSKRQEKKWMDNECYATGVVKDIDKEKLELKIKLKKSCDRKGIVVLKYDVYDTINGQLQKIQEDKIEIMKKGEIRWSYYALWDIKER